MDAEIPFTTLDVDATGRKLGRTVDGGIGAVQLGGTVSAIGAAIGAAMGAAGAGVGSGEGSHRGAGVGGVLGRAVGLVMGATVSVVATHKPLSGCATYPSSCEGHADAMGFESDAACKVVGPHNFRGDCTDIRKGF